MKTLHFYEEDEGKWFIELPEYLDEDLHPDDDDYEQRNKQDLQMVLGADTFLQEISEGEGKVSLLISLDSKEIRDWEGLPQFVNHKWDFLIRADYVKTFVGKYYTGYNNRYIWLGPVFSWIFDEYPQYVYYKIVKNENS